jgi:hypothetical protein
MNGCNLEAAERLPAHAFPLVPGNFLAFQIGWWAVVLTAADGHPWIGSAVVGVLVMGHLAWIRRHRSEAFLLAAAAAIGLGFDSLLLASGWVEFTGKLNALGLAPYWMPMLWVNFAMTLNVSLRWLQGFPLTGALLGAVGGPLAYWGGAKLGAMSFADPTAGLFAIGFAWSLLTPLLLTLANRLDRRRREVRGPQSCSSPGS